MRTAATNAGSRRHPVTTAVRSFHPTVSGLCFAPIARKPERLQIHVIGIDGQNEVEVTDQPEHVNWAPYWHPTKPLLIWTHADHSDPRRRPNYDLFVMPYTVVDGKFVPGEVTRITDSPAADVLPVFSPDGTRLMWTSTRTADGSSQLFIADFHLPQ